MAEKHRHSEILLNFVGINNALLTRSEAFSILLSRIWLIACAATHHIVLSPTVFKFICKTYAEIQVSTLKSQKLFQQILDFATKVKQIDQYSTSESLN